MGRTLTQEIERRWEAPDTAGNRRTRMASAGNHHRLLLETDAVSGDRQTLEVVTAGDSQEVVTARPWRW